MKRLRGFDYHEPGSLGEAVRILGEAGSGARVLAGGTDLLVDMKAGRMRPATVVNLKRIPGLAGIEADEDGTRIGALTAVAAIQESPVVGNRHPALAEAAGVLASPPVRRLATIGGNIARASPASDLGPPLVAAEAVATIRGRDGTRHEPVENLYAGPGTTTLSGDEVITSVFVPAPVAGSGSSHLKIGTRGGGTDIALVGVSAAVTLGDGGVIASAGLVLASVAPTPLRARDAERLLVGRPPTDEALAAAADAAAGACAPISDVRAGAGHRRALVRVLTRRVLLAALARAAGEAA
jgi:carbon-monoxide dehydrogenase medium subunit